MTTSVGTESEIGIDGLDGLFEDRPFPRRELVPASPAIEAKPRGVHPIHSEDWNAPDKQTLSAFMRRSLRTTAPFAIADMIALSLCGLIAQAVVTMVYPPAAHCLGWSGSAVALLPLLLAYWLGDLYSEIWVHPVIELRQLTHVSTVALLAAAVGGALAMPLPIWCVSAWLVALVLVPLGRILARRFCGNQSWWGYPTLVIGSGQGADALARGLLMSPYSGLRPVVLSDPDHICRVSVMPVVNDPSTLESIVRAQGIQHAVVSLPDFSSARLSQMLDQYGGLIPHLLVLSDASTLPSLWGASRRCGRLSGIEIRNGLLLGTLRALKRFVDLSIAIAVMVLASPLFLAIAIAVKLTSKGPIFYGHTRLGRNGKRFKAWKFRSMHQNSDAMLREYLAKVVSAQAEWDRDHKLRNDPRVTKIGDFLRKSSLDELPQIWNVFRGDMSLVGPRPIVDAEVPRYGDVYRLYSTVEPGITGLWQASGRTNLSYDDRVRLDEFYVRHWSPWLDVYILAKTVVALINRHGAY